MCAICYLSCTQPRGGDSTHSLPQCHFFGTACFPQFEMSSHIIYEFWNYKWTQKRRWPWKICVCIAFLFFHSCFPLYLLLFYNMVHCHIVCINNRWESHGELNGPYWSADLSWFERFWWDITEKYLKEISFLPTSRDDLLMLCLEI
jgi:hypothetical protein